MKAVTALSFLFAFQIVNFLVYLLKTFVNKPPCPQQYFSSNSTRDNPGMKPKSFLEKIAKILGHFPDFYYLDDYRFLMEVPLYFYKN